MPATKTRSRKPSGSKKTSAKSNAKDKAAAKKAAKKAREAKAAERAKAQEAERRAAIKDGALIVDGDFEFHRTNGDAGEVEKRAEQVLAALKKSKTPVVGRELMDDLGGGWPQYLSMFSLLKAQGLVIEYRRRSGERGGSGVAYLHVDNA